jgi:NADH dehydrogenase
MKRVVVVGGGFGGLAAVRSLAGADVGVTLVDRRNHHLFQPLLYQVATAALSAPDIAAPLRRILHRQRNVSVILDEVTGIDPASRTLQLTGSNLPYDHLVLATGASHSYFGHDEWAEHAPGLKSLEDALSIRSRVLLAYEAAERTDDDAERRACLTFVVVGGGPTGVELAGALAEIARFTLTRNFRRFDPRDARVVLVEGEDRVLGTYPRELSESARRQLERLGAEVRTDALVTHVDAGGVEVGSERIEARTVLWAAGVAASPLGQFLGTPLDRAGRVLVEPDLTVPGHPEIFVVGDLAAVQSDGRPVPGIAPAAIQMGVHAAHAIGRQLRGESVDPFRYRDKGTMATIGRSSAICVIGRLHLSGLVAWLAWLLVHIFFLIGFRNRAAVMLEWAWAYLTYQRSARVILDRQ